MEVNGDTNKVEACPPPLHLEEMQCIYIQCFCVALSSGRSSPVAKRPRTEVQTNNEENKEEEEDENDSECDDSVEPPDV